MTELPFNEQDDEQELYEHHRIVVDKGQNLLRIDKFLMSRIENATRTKIQKAAEGSCILVNDKPVKPSYKVKPLDVISIVLPNPPRNPELIAENIPVDIQYEDDDLLIVNKAAGMVVHPGYNNYTGTLVNALLYHFQQLPGHTDEMRPGLVHRIDKDTSGLLVIAKTEDALVKLAKQFYDHTIQRRYLALAWGNFDNDTGTIDANLSRDPADRRRNKVFEDEAIGKQAVTHYKVLERFTFATLIECRLETGRTHQIRAHMKYIGHPLFNDAMYGGDVIRHGATFSKFKAFMENCFALMPRQALHAASLGFIHPKTRKEMYFECPPPADFSAVLEKWRSYVNNL